jgi:hypothetical protein
MGLVEDDEILESEAAVDGGDGNERLEISKPGVRGKKNASGAVELPEFGSRDGAETSAKISGATHFDFGEVDGRSAVGRWSERDEVDFADFGAPVLLDNLMILAFKPK